VRLRASSRFGRLVRQEIVEQTDTPVLDVKHVYDVERRSVRESDPDLGGDALTIGQERTGKRRLGTAARYRLRVEFADRLLSRSPPPQAEQDGIVVKELHDRNVLVTYARKVGLDDLFRIQASCSRAGPAGESNAAGWVEIDSIDELSIVASRSRQQREIRDRLGVDARIAQDRSQGPLHYTLCARDRIATAATEGFPKQRRHRGRHGFENFDPLRGRQIDEFCTE
jgi:hypothetical protein